MSENPAELAKELRRLADLRRESVKQGLADRGCLREAWAFEQAARMADGRDAIQK